MLYARFKYPENGYDADKEYAKSIPLKINERYAVEDVFMGQSNTSITLIGIPGSFNSVQFEFETPNGNPIDIYKSKKYNPYL